MSKRVALFFIRFYQRFISPFSFGSCRYYPSCSEYAKWQFENNSFLKAFLASILRICRCNKFFSGGFDYPVIKLSKIKPVSRKKIKVKYWLVPIKDEKFLVIKDLKSEEN